MQSLEMRVLDVLALTRAIVEAGWCKGEYARTKTRRWRLPTATDASHYCLLGALELAWNTLLADLPAPVIRTTIFRSLDLLAEAQMDAGGDETGKAAPGLAGWNDLQTSKYPVLRLLDHAASRVGKG